MRLGPALPLLLLFAVAPVAEAQLPSAALSEIRLGLPADAVDPGATVHVDVTAVRNCPNPTLVLAEQDIQLLLGAQGTPGQDPVGTLHFPQHACATGSGQAGAAAFDLAVPADAPRDANLSYAMTFAPDELEPTEAGVRGDQQVPFLIATTPEPPAPPPEEPAPEKDAPGPGSLWAFVALATVAVALRRRP